MAFFKFNENLPGGKDLKAFLAAERQARILGAKVYGNIDKMDDLKVVDLFGFVANGQTDVTTQAAIDAKAEIKSAIGKKLIPVNETAVQAKAAMDQLLDELL